MAYLVGMLANSLPIPGGFFAVEGGLVGMLLLFGVRPASTVLAAVVTYRAISLWIPALIGTVAFLSLRGEIGKPLDRRSPAVRRASLSRTGRGRPARVAAARWQACPGRWRRAACTAAGRGPERPGQ